MKAKFIFPISIGFLLLTLSSCKKNYYFVVSKDEVITSFIIPQLNNQEAIINDHEIIINVPDTITDYQFTPQISTYGAWKIYPYSGVMLDFKDTVEFKVEAKNGEFFTYSAYVNVISTECKILDINLPNILNNTIIGDSTVFIRLQQNTDISNLTPIINISPGAQIEILNDSVYNFLKTIKVKVTSAAGNFRNYKIKVVRDLTALQDSDVFIDLVGSTRHIIEFVQNGVDFYVPQGTDITKMPVTISSSTYPRVSPKITSTLDLTEPKQFVLSDDKGNSRRLTVSVSVSPWKEEGKGAFSPRDGVGLVVFKDHLWLVGGYTGTGDALTVSEVWRSADGINWEFVTNAPWPNRHCAGVVVFNDKLWVISGDGHKDVWSSEDGENWELVQDNAPWGRRYSPYVAVYQGKLWLMGGFSWWDEEGAVDYTGVRGFNDVWNSEDGKNWTQVRAITPWAPRGLIHGYAVLNDELYIIGGGIKVSVDALGQTSETSAEYNDVWKTSDGHNWVRVLSEAPFAKRTHYSLTVHNGAIYVTDGSVQFQSVMSNQVWRSYDGLNWEEVKYSFWSPRHASGLVSFHNRLWLISGYLVNDIWSMP